MTDSVDSDNELFEDSVDHTYARQDNMDDRLTAILERLVAGQQDRPPPAPRSFKPPEFDGRGDVEFFIRQFQEVSEANEWNDRAELLSLRASLKDAAQDCGKAVDVRGVFGALRARYGTSPREARNKLLGLKKEYKTGLQEHAAEVEGLIELAFADLPGQTRNEMALETFCSTLGNAYMQRHLLAIRPASLEEAVRAGNEFLQIRPSPNTGVRGITEEEADAEPETQTRQIKADPMEALLAAIANLTKEVQQLKLSSPIERKGDAPRKVVKCWGCGGEGHLRNKCPSQPWTEQSGNAKRPQQ